nr:uncharacterized protein LOC117281397 [Nicotiana tomentosiformis]
MSDKIKEDIMKKLNANVVRAVRYTTWVTNVVPVPKKDGKTRLTNTCEPIFKLLKKAAAIKWMDDCQKAFDMIKYYLSKPPVLVPSEPGQHDAKGKKEQSIYYLSKKFTNYEPMPTGRLAKCQILLTECDIAYVTCTAIKEALAYHLVENPVNDDYNTLSTYFLDKEVSSIEEAVSDDIHVWKMYFAGAINIKGVGIGAIFISPIGQHYPAMARLNFFCTTNTAEYEACIMGLKIALDLDVHELLNQHGYCNTVETDPEGEPWYHDIKRFLKTREYPEYAKGDQTRTIRRLAGANLNSHLMKELYEQFKIMHRHSTPYRTKANGAVKAANMNIKKILMKMIQGSKKWHEKLPFALLGYHTTAHISVGATPLSVGLWN